MNPLLQYWYFHLPNFVLAALMYTLIGRLVLGLFVRPDWRNYIWRFFVRVTDPVLAAVRAVTPSAFGAPIAAIFAVIWLMLLRAILFIGLARLNLLPTMAG